MYPGLHWMSIQKETCLLLSSEENIFTTIKSHNIHSSIGPTNKQKTKPEYISSTKGPFILKEKHNFYVESNFLVCKDNW